MTRERDPAVLILGPPAFKGHDGIEPFEGLLLKRLLITLCAYYPQPISSHDLSDCLWDDQRPATWDTSLRVHIGRMRKMFELGNTGIRIDFVGDGYVIDAKPDQFDFFRFSDATRDSSISLHATDRLNLLNVALSFWRGPMSIVFDSPKVQSFVDRLTGNRTVAEQGRFRALVELGQPEVVVAELADRVRHEPRNEALVEPLVAAFMLLGQFGQAQEILNRTKKALQESGLEAGVAIQSLQRQLLRDEFASIGSGKTRGSTPERRAIFGRNAELRRLREFIEADGKVVVVEGEPGVGKSHLLEAMAQDLSAEGLSVFLANCGENSPPGQVFADLLAAGSPSLRLSNLESADALGMFLAGLSGVPRPIVVVENLQNIDLLSLKLLRRFLLQSEVGMGCLVLSTRQGPWAPYVRDFLVDLRVGPNSAHINLEALSRDAVDVWLSSIFVGRRADRWTFAGRLHQLTGGLPLLIELLLQVKPDFDELTSADSVQAQLDPLISTRSDLLPEWQLDVVSFAAVCGSTFDPSLVAHVSGNTMAQTNDALDAAAVSGLVLHQRSRTATFRHDLIRLSLISQKSQEWRCNAHVLIAKTMEKRGYDSGLICIHLASALSNATDDTEVENVLERVRGLQGAHRWDISSTILQICEENFLVQPWLFSAQSLIDLYRLLGKSLEGSHDASRSRSAFRRAIELCADHPELIELVGLIAVESAGGSQPFDGDSERLAWLRLAFENPALTLRTRLSVLSEFAYLQSIVGVTDEVRVAVEELRSIALHFGDDESFSISAHGELVSLLPGCDAEVCIGICDALLLHDLSMVRAETRLTAVVVKMVSHLQLGQLDRASVCLGLLWQCIELTQRPGEQWLGHIVECVLFDWSGELLAADDQGRRAVDLARRHDVHGGTAVWFAFLLSRAVRDDAWDDVFAALEELDLPVVERSNDMFADVVELLILAQLGMFTGREALLDGLVEKLSTQPKFLGWIGVVALASEVSMRAGGQSAEQLFDLMRPYSGTIIVLGVAPAAVFGPVDHYLSRLLKRSGDVAEARKYAYSAHFLALGAGLVGWLPKLAQSLNEFEESV